MKKTMLFNFLSHFTLKKLKTRTYKKRHHWIKFEGENHTYFSFIVKIKVYTTKFYSFAKFLLHFIH